MSPARSPLKPEHENSTFRVDIEILRGVAVLLVLLYHAQIDLFRSGFIGVDVFFVLSGYLMGVAFKNHSVAGMVEFLDRRARRVLPACLLVVLFCAIGAPFLLLPFEAKAVTDALAATLLLAPNLLFWASNDYFSDHTFRPFLHYWSLGVEFQYYLAFPVLIMLFRNSVRALIVVFVASLAFAVVLAQVSPKTGFYWMPPRAWEFLAGYFVWRWHNGDGRSLSLRAQRAGEALAPISMLSIVVLSMFAIPVQSYPGLYALAPVSLTVLVLAASPQQIHRWPQLFTGPLRFLGRISYSLYLIHFPLLVLAAYAPFSVRGELTAAEALVALVSSVVLAHVAYRWIEQPLRNRHRWPSRQFAAGMLVLVLLSGAAVWVLRASDHGSRRYPPRVQETFFAVEDVGDWRCGAVSTLRALGRETCSLLANPGAERRLLLVGDSHLDSLKSVLVSEAHRHNHELASSIAIDLVKENCKLGQGACLPSNILKLAGDVRATDLILHSLWSKRPYDAHRKLAQLLAKEDAPSLRVHIVDPVPIYPVSVPYLVYRERSGASNDGEFRRSESAIRSQRSRYYQMKNEVQPQPGIFFYDSLSALCDDDICRTDDERGVFYHDKTHLSLTGAETLRPIAQQLYSNLLPH